MANSYNFGVQDTSGSIGSKFGSSDDSHLMILTKKAISRVVELRLERYWWNWKANSNINKAMPSEYFLIPMFTRSKEPLFTSRLNTNFPIWMVRSPIPMVWRSSTHIVWSSALGRHIDVDQIDLEFMWMNGNDVSIKTPRRMVTHSQTRRTGEDRPDCPSAHPDP